MDVSRCYCSDPKVTDDDSLLWWKGVCQVVLQASTEALALDYFSILHM